MKDITTRRWQKLIDGCDADVVGIVSLLLLNLAVARAYSRCRLPAAAYGDGSYLAHLHEAGWRLLPLLALFVLLAVRRDRIRWQVIGDRKYLRFLVMVPIAVFAWKFSTYDYNLFFDQSHLLERSVLLACAVLVYRHPV